MLSSFRNRFGIPGVISVIALVFAMLGGAYAASNDSGSGKASASAKAKKGPRGPRGPKGPAGPAGPQGPAGPAGAKGDTGAAGSNGSNGSNGAAGATGKTGSTGATGKTGLTGPTGPTGSPWSAGGTLPPGETETGTWAISGSGVEGATTHLFGPISYTIPLAEPSEKVVALNLAQTAASTTTPIEGCEYEVSNPAALPVAPAGTLCVFTVLEEWGHLTGILTPSAIGDRVTGAFVKAQPESLGTAEEAPPVLAQLLGVWAVTAAEE